MNHDEIVKKITDLRSDGHFRMLVDVKVLKEIEEEILEEYNSVRDELKKLWEVYNKEPFNPNSNEQRKILLADYIPALRCMSSVSKDKYEKYAGSYPVAELLCRYGSLQKERQFLQGNAKGEGRFDKVLKDLLCMPFEGEIKLFEPEMSVAEGRIYWNKAYQMPQRVRKAIVPPMGKEFLYMDLSAAELCFVAHLAKDEVLLNDILSGTFWDTWYMILGVDSRLKADLKVAIYSVIYSGSDVCIPNSIPPKFFQCFLQRYKVLNRFIRSTMSCANYQYMVKLWDGREVKFAPTDSKRAIKALNYPIQFGLADIVQLCVIEICKYGKVATTVFDSILAYDITLS